VVCSLIFLAGSWTGSLLPQCLSLPWQLHLNGQWPDWSFVNST